MAMKNFYLPVLAALLQAALALRLSAASGWFRGQKRARSGQAHCLSVRRRRVSLGGGVADAGEDPGERHGSKCTCPVRHQPRQRRNRANHSYYIPAWRPSTPPMSVSWPCVSGSCPRPRSTLRGVPQRRQANHRAAHQHARLCLQSEQARLRGPPSTIGGAGTGPAGLAGRSWAKPGSTTTAGTVSRARAASWMRPSKTTPFCAA